MSTNTEDLVIGEGDVAKAQELHQRGLAAEAEGDRVAAIEAPCFALDQAQGRYEAQH